MNYDAQTIIQKELDSGEKLLWAGSPKQGMMLKGSDVFMISFCPSAGRMNNSFKRATADGRLTAFANYNTGGFAS